MNHTYCNFCGALHWACEPCPACAKRKIDSQQHQTGDQRVLALLAEILANQAIARNGDETLMHTIQELTGVFETLDQLVTGYIRARDDNDAKRDVLEQQLRDQLKAAQNGGAIDAAAIDAAFAKYDKLKAELTLPEAPTVPVVDQSTGTVVDPVVGTATEVPA